MVDQGGKDTYIFKYVNHLNDSNGLPFSDLVFYCVFTVVVVAVGLRVVVVVQLCLHLWSNCS